MSEYSTTLHIPQTSYGAFLDAKLQQGSMHGFPPTFLPEELYDFQRDLVTWALQKGRAAIFADCGLGKTLIELVWAENVVRHTGGRVLILAPLAVAPQTVREGLKFDIPCAQSRDGTLSSPITVANYEQLHHFSSQDFAGVVLDESAVLKHYTGVRQRAVTEFLRPCPYRLLCTATAAPNDYIELGTSSEALGELGHIDMLNRFFRNEKNTSSVATGGRYMRAFIGQQWRFKGHAEIPFWRWVSSWARAVRKPSDIGFSNEGFELPPLIERSHVVDVERPRAGMLFNMPAVGLKE